MMTAPFQVPPVPRAFMRLIVGRETFEDTKIFVMSAQQRRAGAGRLPKAAISFS